MEVQAVSTGFDIVAFIKDFGFPIACCVALFIMLVKQNKEHKEEVTALKDTIYDLKTSFVETSANQSRELTQAINNNTLALQKLSDKLEDTK